ncbi:hypothetical protein FACS1894189_8440 [Planctomycetales bacterium]|nr:hypothetical protein FACS1894189_8440 [Planctomycetales bacterium]
MLSSQQEPLLYSQIDVLPSYSLPATKPAPESSTQLCGLMREVVSSQDRQTALLEEMVALVTHSQRRRLVELGLWKQSNPELAEFCKRAAKKLERVQSDLLSTLTEEIDDNSETLLENEYGLNEFIDRYGTRFIQLHSLLQILTQLGNAPDIQLHSNEVTKDN